MKFLFTVFLVQLLVTPALSQADTILIKSKIQKYRQSIENADTLLAYQIWQHTPEISFIQPRGHQHGWKEINGEIYKFFGDMFSKRSLKIYNENITVYNDVAWAEFYWVFDAIFKQNNTPLQTKGRETQIWHKSNNEWHLVHVHYSNMPVTAAGQWF